jgi:hypothetical protein
MVLLVCSRSTLLITPDLVILEHTLNGRIDVFRIDIFELLSESLSDPVDREIVWLGHADNISKLGRTVDGRGLISKGSSGGAIAWAIQADGKIRQRAVLPFEEASFSVTLLAGMHSSPQTRLTRRPILPRLIRKRY